MITSRPIRKKLGITQKELANKLGVTPNAISQWENGVRNPSLENVKRLADILHCTTDDILKGEQNERH
ncbi:MAG: helix-turn-helix domain-containing protein [Ruminococcus sp.]